MYHRTCLDLKIKSPSAANTFWDRHVKQIPDHPISAPKRGTRASPAGTPDRDVSLGDIELPPCESKHLTWNAIRNSARRDILMEPFRGVILRTTSMAVSPNSEYCLTSMMPFPPGAILRPEGGMTRPSRQKKWHATSMLGSPQLGDLEEAFPSTGPRRRPCILAGISPRGAPRSGHCTREHQMVSHLDSPSFEWQTQACLMVRVSGYWAKHALYPEATQAD